MRRNKYKKKRKIFPFILSLLVIIGCVFSIGKVYVNNLSKNMDMSTGEAKEIFKKGKPFNVLLLGTDVGTLGRNEKGRTDTIMVATVSPQNKDIQLTSLSRDIMIKVPGHSDLGIQKLNSAYTFGGINTTKQVISNYLNIPIEGYVLINMKGVIKTIDELGGIEIKSPISFTFSQETSKSTGKNLYRFTKGQTEYEYSNDYGQTWTKKKVMNGDAALAFSRMRYDDPDGDFGRQKRQRMVLQAISKKIKDVKNLLNPTFLNSLSNSIKTDLSLNDALTIYSKYSDCLSNIKSSYLHTKEYMYNGSSYQYATNQEKQKVTNNIRKLLGLKEEQTGTLLGEPYSNSDITQTDDDFATEYNSNSEENENNNIDFNKIKENELKEQKQNSSNEKITEQEKQLLEDSSDVNEEEGINLTNQ